MACVAAFLDHGRVRAGFQQPWLGRGVGIVAARAGGCLHRIIPVGLFETPFGRVMAGEAKGCFCLHQQVFLA